MNILLSNTMATITFKAEDDFKKKLEAVAGHRGINVSAYIKLCLTKEVRTDLSEITENGMTVAEELEILRSDTEDPTYGPFETVEELMESLNSKV